MLVLLMSTEDNIILSCLNIEVNMKKNLLSIMDLKKDEIEEIFKLADLGEDIFREYDNLLDKKILCSIFLQPSTRTQFSFQSSFIRLGGHCMSITDIENTRSGCTYHEPLDDMARMLNNYCDIIVMRSSKTDDINLFLQGCEKTIISAGSGYYEHPTQALIDLYTINRIFKQIDGINILIIGTPNQRTINSLLLGLSLWDNIVVNILCENDMTLPNHIAKSIGNIYLRYYHSWDELLSSRFYKDIVAVYVTEIKSIQKSKDCFNLTDEIMLKFTNSPIILSPLPRTDQLPKSIDSFQSARYYFQAKQGIYVRAGLFVKYFK